MIVSLKLAHKAYLEKGGQVTDFLTFREILGRFNEIVMERVIVEMETFDMGCNLSTLSIVRRKNRNKTPHVNWKKSNKLKAEILARGGTLYYPETSPDGERWLVFFNPKFYIRFYWKKSSCQIQNKTAYQFKTTRGKKGNKALLARTLKGDPLGVSRFPLVKTLPRP